jgi:HKD family nuclease
MDASLAIIVDVPRFILSLSLYLSISLCKRKEKKKINFYVYRNKINNFNSIFIDLCRTRLYISISISIPLSHIASAHTTLLSLPWVMIDATAVADSN